MIFVIRKRSAGPLPPSRPYVVHTMRNRVSRARSPLLANEDAGHLSCWDSPIGLPFRGYHERLSRCCPLPRLGREFVRLGSGWSQKGVLESLGGVSWSRFGLPVRARGDRERVAPGRACSRRQHPIVAITEDPDSLEHHLDCDPRHAHTGRRSESSWTSLRIRRRSSRSWKTGCLPRRVLRMPGQTPLLHSIGPAQR